MISRVSSAYINIPSEPLLYAIIRIPFRNLQLLLLPLQLVSTTAVAKPAEEWVSFEIINSTPDTTITVKNAIVTTGQFYSSGNQSEEVSADDISSMTISANSTGHVNACGLDGQMDGTEGQFDLYAGNTKLRTVSWNNGPGGKHNNVEASHETQQEFFCDVMEPDGQWSALGNVQIEIEKRGRK
ncbi:hemolysin [Diplodia corticola]|uniref:Hemolysin n=1 Tax=Diplodia corticola TaxID=236234 RepID=A0A1J9RPI3_9PEZI|nr:hemolysin [Diplodia corticola]OJD30375.1 hemolysin [Diplodia corticola]